VSAGFWVIFLMVAIRLGALLLPELVPLGVCPSSGALSRFVLSSGLLMSGRPGVVLVNLCLASVQQTLTLPDALCLLFDASLGLSALLLLDHVGNLFVPRGNWGCLAGRPVGMGLRPWYVA
jgi:hypothetical protein